MKPFQSPFPPYLFAAAALSAASTLAAQTWVEVETFPNGQASGTWASVGTPSVSTSMGYLDLRLAPGSNSTSTYRVSLPQTYTSGKLTVAFDFYLPAGERQNSVGFGIGGATNAAATGWGPIGNRNRFQSVSPHPQNMAKVPNWSSDIFGDTGQGIWYNVWLVYDLSADPKTVTSYTKPAALPLEEGNLIVQSFPFDSTSIDDWSALNYFGFGVGNFDDGQAPTGFESWQTLGLLADNIHVSTGENLTQKPTSVEQDWIFVESFAGGAPEADWTVGAGLNLAFEDESLVLTGTAANAALYTELPLASDMRQAFTVTFDLLLPSAGSGLSNIQFGVVGEAQTALTGAELFGGPDRFLTYGTASPQPLANFGQFDLAGGLLGGTVLDQWYHVWLVYDGSAQKVDFYSVPVADPVESVEIPSEPAGSYALEGNYLDLTRLVFGTALLANGSGVRLDNIYQAPGILLSLSPTAGQSGSGETGGLPVGEWTRTAIGWVFGLTPDWGISTYIGYVYMANYPYVYQLHTDWIYHVGTSNEVEHVFYDWELGWMLASESNGGWYFAFTEDIQQGEWGRFPPLNP